MTLKPLFDSWRAYVSGRQEPVLKEWLEGFDWDLPEAVLAPVQFHATRHLPACQDFAGSAETNLVQTLIESAENVHWIQMWEPEDFGQYFVDNYVHMQLIGPEGHFKSQQIAGGLVMYGPHTHYPNHWHDAEEIYIPLTGNGLWSKDNEDYVLRDSGEFIFHESNMPHAMKCEESPMLALWMWRGGDLWQKANY
ncbi:MAG: dimethylsulfonioproprionate lyase family protein [Pseudomonadota bacterium]